MWIIILFSIISLVAVLLHDFKYLLFLNGNNKIKAVTVCGVYNLFNTIVVKHIAGVDLIISCIVVTVTAMISMWIAMSYSEKHIKEYVYKFEITTKNENCKTALEEWFKDNNVPYKRFWYFFNNDKKDEQGDTKYHEFDIYAFTKEHSKKLTQYLNTFDKKDVKYMKLNTGNYKE